jgi:hypothetical protein
MNIDDVWKNSYSENKNKVMSIEEQMAEFEARLRRQLAREKLHDQGKVQDSFDTGAMPTIHVSLGALAASKPAGVREYETVSGD